MSENYQFPLKINELADLSGISKYHFIRLFKSNYHLSPAKYLVNCRVNNAQKDLIQKNNSSMAEIATKMAFMMKVILIGYLNNIPAFHPKNLNCKLLQDR